MNVFRFFDSSRATAAISPKSSNEDEDDDDEFELDMDYEYGEFNDHDEISKGRFASNSHPASSAGTPSTQKEQIFGLKCTMVKFWSIVIGLAQAVTNSKNAHPETLC